MKSTKESLSGFQNKIKEIKDGGVYLPTLTALICIQSSKLYESFYHGLFSSIFREIIINSLIISLGFISLLLMSRLLKANFLHRLISASAIIWYFRNVYINPTISGMGMYIYLLSIFLSAALIFYTSIFLNSVLWRKFVQISICAMLFSALSPSIIRFFQENRQETPTFDLSNIIRDRPKATLIVVLDEFSPEMSGLLKAVFRDGRHILHYSLVRSSGENTINAIPSMLTNQRHDNVIPCGTSSLCGDRSFNMNNLMALSNDVDVVGFWHPYCAIRKLRSCKVISYDDIRDSKFLTNIAPEVFRRLPITSRFTKKDDFNYLISVEEQIKNASYAAPFWNGGGGLLFIHMPTPHPHGGSGNRLLYHEYLQNTLRSRIFIEDNIKKLRSHFGDDFVIIITSDHSLRTKMWCDSPTYKSPDCLLKSPQPSNFVPLFVFAPREKVVHKRSDNLGLFAGPYLRSFE